MSGNKYPDNKQVGFEDITPEMQIKKVDVDKLYEKVNLDRKEAIENLHSRNTSTWD